MKTEKPVISESNLKGNKLPFCISVNFRDTFKTRLKQIKQSFCVAISRREKDGAKPTIFYVLFLIMVDMSLSKNIEVFVLVSAKFKCQILLHGVFEITNIGIYLVLTIEIFENKTSLIQFHNSPNSEDQEGLLKCLKETQVSMKKGVVLNGGIWRATGSGFFKFLTTLKLLKTTKITISQKTPFFKITKR